MEIQKTIIAEAEYADIIITLLRSPYNINSIIKLVFIAFCVKNGNNTKTYRKRTKDFIDTFLSSISIKLVSHPDDISIIFDVIEKLEQGLFISIDNDKINICKTLSFNTENEFLKFCANKNPNPILEVNKLAPKAFMEEVLQYV